jgi:hypothetical protein
MRLPTAFLIALLPLAAAAQTSSAPRSIADCEKISAALAYNECLASFGPRVGERRARAAVAEPADGEERQVRRRGRGGRSVVRGRRGRQAAAFEIRRGRASAVQKARPSRGKRAYRRRR